MDCRFEIESIPLCVVFAKNIKRILSMLLAQNKWGEDPIFVS